MANWVNGQTFKFSNKYKIICNFATIYVFLIFARPYSFESGPGWLDPWVSLGYGQVFPKTAYQFHYYKESRLVSILWEFILTRFPSNWANALQSLIVTLCGLVIISILAEFGIANFTSLSISLVIVLCPTLWGDWAGGGDYFNTLGNFLIAIACSRVFSILSKSQSLNWKISKKWIEIGAWLFLIISELPSGIVVSAIIELLIAFLWVLTTSKNKNLRSSASELVYVLYWQVIGAVLLFSFEGSILVLLGQSPTRLLSGLKFLFQSIINSKIQGSWWSQIPFDSLKGHDSILLFFGLWSILVVLLFSMILNYRHKTATSASDKFLLALLLSSNSIYLMIFLAQVTGKTIALTTSYFTTPFLFVACITIAIGSFGILKTYDFSNISWKVLTLFVVLQLIIGFKPGIFFCIIAAIFIIISISNLIRQKLPTSAYFYVSFSTICLLIFLSTSLSSAQSKFSLNPAYGLPASCNKMRVLQRSQILSIAKKLDHEFGKRGTLTMGVSDAVFKSRIISKCSEFDEISIAVPLLALAEMGFPAASSLGNINSNIVQIKNDFPYESLSNILNRQNLPNGCYVDWRIPKKPEFAKVTLLGVSLDYYSNCN